MIVLRIDVDYAYNNRVKSFLSAFLRAKLGGGYLENSKTIAKMVNASPNSVKCFWFFTVASLPDREMLSLINNSRHIVCLHAVEDVYGEYKVLVKHLTKFSFPIVSCLFNQHGIKRFPMNIIWHKMRIGLRNSKSLTYFSNDGTLGLDTLCYEVGQKKALEAIGENIIYVHPDWLFQNGLLNRRGRYFEVLELLLSSYTLNRKA